MCIPGAEWNDERGCRKRNGTHGRCETMFPRLTHNAGLSLSVMMNTINSSDIEVLGGSGPLLRMADMSPFWSCTSLTIQF